VKRHSKVFPARTSSQWTEEQEDQMSYPIEECIAVNTLDIARRLHVCEDVLARARNAPAAASLVPYAQATLDLHIAAVSRDAEWQLAQQDHALHDDGAMALHKVVTRTLSTFEATLEWVEATGSPEEQQAARATREMALPNQTGGVSTKVYVGMYAYLKVMLTRLAGPEFAVAMALPAVAMCVERLAKFNEEFGSKLTRPERMTFDDVKRADLESYVAYVSLYARICGTFPTNDADDLTVRSALLQPAFDAQAEAAKHRADRRAAMEAEREAAKATAGATSTGGSAQAASAEGEEPSAGDAAGDSAAGDEAAETPSS
jgi:hypothetical protein